MNSMHFSDQPDSQQGALLSSQLQRQLENQMLALQAGAQPLGELHRLPQPVGQGPTLQRVLVIAQGARATAVAEAVVAATRRWLPPPHPLAWVAGHDNEAGEETLEEAVRTAAEQLASRELAAALFQAGYRLDRHAEFHIWLVVDLDSQPGSESGAPAAAVALLGRVERAIWRALRLRTLPHALLLASPQTGAEAACWAATLQQANVADVCLCGSVNLEHQSLVEEEWVQQSALALAALCWGILPSHAQREQTGSIRILGAAAWASSLPTIRQWLALRTALAAVRRLEDDAPPAENRSAADGGPADGGPAAAGAAIDVMEWNAQLAARVPEPLGLKQWLGGQPSWENLQKLGANLVAEEQQEGARSAINGRQARMNWLDTTVDRWSAQFETMRQTMLAPVEGLPAPTIWQARVDQVVQRLVGAQAAVDEALEQASQHLEQQQAAEAAAVARIQAVTREFPALPGWSGLLALLQFWRWPMLLWCWFHLLPERCQALYAVQAQRRLAGWREANWHVLRQLLLALQMRTRQATQEYVALKTTLAEVAAALQRRLDGLAQAGHLVPWSAETLEDLWEVADNSLVDERLAVYLREHPLPTWANGDPSAQAEALAAAMATPEPALTGWSALECLVNGLERSEVRRRDPVEHLLARKPLRQPFAWLDEQAQRALPLWPKPSLRPDLAGQNWLLLPASGISTAHTNNRTAVAKVNWWLDTLAEPAEAAICSGEALVFLRWVNIPISDLENEQ